MAGACQGEWTGSPGTKSIDADFIVFRIDAQRFAVPIERVERVVRAVAEAPLPNAPAIVSGLINMRGSVVPVISMRRRAGLPERPLRSSDCLIIARTPQRTVALAADAVEGLVHVESENLARGTDILPEVPYMAGVAKQDDGLLLIFDLERFLSLEEERALDGALQEAPA